MKKNNIDIDLITLKLNGLITDDTALARVRDFLVLYPDYRLVTDQSHATIQLLKDIHASKNDLMFIDVKTEFKKLPMRLRIMVRPMENNFGEGSGTEFKVMQVQYSDVLEFNGPLFSNSYHILKTEDDAVSPLDFAWVQKRMDVIKTCLVRSGNSKKRIKLVMKRQQEKQHAIKEQKKAELKQYLHEVNNLTENESTRTLFEIAYELNHKTKTTKLFNKLAQHIKQ